ncbi:MAG: head GIN domain-containing protein [Petrimonas sp.]|jgi:hypothetical protein|uniref:head GIN domain-containing protein n=1 Tax=Petrimonas sp. TaxID=2023866 RepID=UPI002B371EDF|nr:head GIN domain-containing protein [Petrimonas sp.]MEA5045734.1 head GIN domain-containing protein [Petrimonas sp.]MEA5061883.1 head GIN domain-containing protein [Petrimonas sp.]HMM18694.1 head GIN domain-containing protein [Petrimonas sp.]
MKTKIILTVILVVTSIVGTSAQGNRTVKRNIEVNPFTSITVSSGWDVIIRQGNRQSVSIEVSEEILERAVIEVKNGTLHVYNKNRNRSFLFQSLRNVTQKVYVTVTDLNKITASGGVDIRFDTPVKTRDFELTMSGGSDLEGLTLACGNFTGSFSGGSDAEITFSNVEEVKADASGGSDIHLINIASRRCRISTSGGSDIELSGKTEDLHLSASGGSDVSASGFEVQDCTAVFSGAADGTLFVTRRLDIRVSGAADVACQGNPADVSKTVSRGSSLKIR